VDAKLYDFIKLLYLMIRVLSTYPLPSRTALQARAHRLRRPLYANGLRRFSTLQTRAGAFANLPADVTQGCKALVGNGLRIRAQVPSRSGRRVNRFAVCPWGYGE